MKIYVPRSMEFNRVDVGKGASYMCLMYLTVEEQSGWDNQTEELVTRKVAVPRSYYYSLN